MERFVSELESEKGTRSRANADIHVHLDRIRDMQERTNRILYMMMGGLVVLQVGLQFFKH